MFFWISGHPVARAVDKVPDPLEAPPVTAIFAPVTPLTDIPLLTQGRLAETRRAQRLAEFATQWEAAWERDDDIAPIFEVFLDDLGAAALMDYFDRRNPSCHGELHSLGELLARRTGNLEQAIGICDSSCTFGCVHGAVAGSFHHRSMGLPGSSGEQALALVPELRRFCSGSGATIPGFFAGNCAHAVGHALQHVAGSGFRASVEGCRRLYGDDMELRFYCETGVFMDARPILLRGVATTNATFAAKVHERMNLCGNLSQLPGACMRFLLPVPRTETEMANLTDQCSQRSGVVRQACFNTAGYLGRWMVSRLPSRVRDTCRGGEPTDRELCLAGLFFAKKRARHQSRIAATWPHLDAIGRKVFFSQFGYPYYRPGNPLLARMWDQTPAPAPAPSRVPSKHTRTGGG
ncbi:MAG: hypothetical protein OEW11_04565 [Nitrospirota bacterium]|nr:hypothetical protein [Nitrospirota bacterium]